MKPATVALLALIFAPAPAQSVLRFDMGDRGTPVAPGFTEVRPTTAYSAALGHGWVGSAPAAFHRPVPNSFVRHSLPAALAADGHSSPTDLDFRVDLPAGTWLVVAHLGDPGSDRALTPRERMDIKANGVEVVSDAFARTARRKAQATTDAVGGVKRVRFLASPVAGALRLTFHADGTRESVNSILGLEFYPYREPPIRFDHASRSLVAGTTWQAALAPALQAFNTHDYALARAELDKVQDPLARAWGQAWLLGWLDGAEQDADPALLGSTRSLLEGLQSPDDPLAACLLADLADFELGLFFNQARGYPVAAFPGSFGDIVANNAAAVAFLEQLEGDLLGQPRPIPECPFYPKARYLIARNMYSRYTGVGDPTAPWAAAWLGILQNEFAPHRGLFPRSAELEVFTFFATRYAQNGGIVHNWRGPTSLPSFDPKGTWWAPLAELTDHPAAPAWANHQRAYLQQFRNAGTWWMTRRLLEGEIGGGGGDDVEGAGLLSLPAIAKNEPGHVLENGIRECMEKVLFGPEIDQDQGYFKGCADVEHAAEYSAYPLFALLPTHFGRPSYLSFATRSMRNLDETADPAAWSRLLAPGRRRFRSYIFGATSVCGPTRDIPCNIRAIIPGFFLLDYNGAPRVRVLFDELARAWASDAMSTAQGKPKGVPPAAVSASDPAVFGTGGSWWLNGGYYDLPQGAGYYSYLYSLLLSAYHGSNAPDRHIFLEPILWCGYLVEDALMGRLTGTLPGLDKWTADTLQSPIASALAEAYPALASDPSLKLTPADLARLRTVIQKAAPPYLDYLNLDPTQTKSKKGLEDAFHQARVWMRWFWVLGTSSVSYTDRCYVFTGGSHQLLYSSMMGGAFGINPTYALSWVNPAPAAGELDIAALVHEIRVDGLDVLLFNHAPAARDVAFRLWRGLERGRYRVSIGDDADHDDRMDALPHTSFDIDFDAPGLTVVLPSVPAGTLQKVELKKISPAASPGLLPDWAIDETLVELRPGGNVAVSVHNLGAAEARGGTLELREGARLLSTHPVPDLPAPNDLTPRSTTLVVPYRPIQAGAPLNVRVIAPPTQREITLANNEITLHLPVDAPLLVLQNPTGFGAFEVALSSPYDAGKLYLIAPGLSGATPGLPLGKGLSLPVNWDLLTEHSFNGLLFNYPVGTLDAQGFGAMRVRIPYDAVLVGLKLTFGAAAFGLDAIRSVAGPLHHVL